MMVSTVVHFATCTLSVQLQKMAVQLDILNKRNFMEVILQ